MEFFETVAKRYSHRTPFLDQPVPDADVRKIVEAGIQAPSGQNCQTTSFVVVTDRTCASASPRSSPPPPPRRRP